MAALRRFVAQTRTDVGNQPFVVRSALLAATVLGLLGGLCGLVLGLYAYPPTAWFAVIEVGAPAALLGAVAGTIGGAVVERLRGGRRGV